MQTSAAVTNLPPSERSVTQVAVSQAAYVDTTGDYPATVVDRSVVALCDDGTLWSYTGRGWLRLPGIPGTAQGIAEARAEAERRAAERAEFERVKPSGFDDPALQALLAKLAAMA